MRRLCGLVFFLLLVTPSFCQATNWQQISHQPQYLIDQDSLTYQKIKTESLKLRLSASLSEEALTKTKPIKWQLGRLILI